MTFREKLKREHPEMVNDRYVGGCSGCPAGYGYEDNMPNCSHATCAECWNREIPGSEALSCSEFPNSSDLISRQAAIDAAKRVLGDHEISRTMQTALHILPSAQPEHTCLTCGRTANNGGWYKDGRTRCPIEEHYALPKDGHCHLWEKQKPWEDDYPERRADAGK